MTVLSLRGSPCGRHCDTCCMYITWIIQRTNKEDNEWTTLGIWHKGEAKLDPDLVSPMVLTLPSVDDSGQEQHPAGAIFWKMLFLGALQGTETIERFSSNCWRGGEGGSTLSCGDGRRRKSGGSFREAGARRGAEKGCW